MAESESAGEKLHGFVKPSGELSELGEGVGLIGKQGLMEAREEILNGAQIDESWGVIAEELNEREAGLTEVADYRDWELRVEQCFEQNQDIIDRMRSVLQSQVAVTEAKLAAPDETGKVAVPEELIERIASLVKQLEDELQHQARLNEMRLADFRRKTKPRENNFADYKAALAREKMLKPLEDALSMARREYNRRWKFYRKQESGEDMKDPTLSQESSRLAEAEAKLEQATTAYNQMIDQLYKGSKYGASMDFSEFYAKLPDLRIPADLLGSKPGFGDEKAKAYTADLPDTWKFPDREYRGVAGRRSLDDAKLSREELGKSINDFYEQLDQIGVAQGNAGEDSEEIPLAA